VTRTKYTPARTGGPRTGGVIQAVVVAVDHQNGAIPPEQIRLLVQQLSLEARDLSRRETVPVRVTRERRAVVLAVAVHVRRPQSGRRGSVADQIAATAAHESGDAVRPEQMYQLSTPGEWFVLTTAICALKSGRTVYSVSLST